MIILSARRRTLWATAMLAACTGTWVAVHYFRLQLTLSHYDSRGHLIVARRVIDSVTPGWQQLGAVWLPLPHLLNLIPVQSDLMFRTGASAVAISVVAFAVSTTAICAIVLRLTDSPIAALVGALVFAANPNVLYLQATPMTEPLLLALTTSAVTLLLAWCETMETAGEAGTQAPPWRSPAAVGLVFALACLTRYEAWPVTAWALVAAVYALVRRGLPWPRAVARVGAIAWWPATALVAFVLFSRVVVGQWFVSDGFFVPENKALGRPLLAVAEVGWGIQTLSGTSVLALAALGVIVLATLALASRRHAPALVVTALAAAAALPWAAFYKGHPFRIRYMVPLIAIEAIGVGTLAGVQRRLERPVAIALLVLLGWELHPLDAKAPMVVEAQWDRPNVAARQHITACLGSPHADGKVMASMGSLGHYMQEASLAGFGLRDFLHEGNGDIWLSALIDPRAYVEWIMMDEKRGGGDMLAMQAREHPRFLDGYSRVCEGAGVALYRRVGASVPDPQNLTLTRNR